MQYCKSVFVTYSKPCVSFTRLDHNLELSICLKFKDSCIIFSPTKKSCWNVSQILVQNCKADFAGDLLQSLFIITQLDYNLELSICLNPIIVWFLAQFKIMVRYFSNSCENPTLQVKHCKLHIQFYSARFKFRADNFLDFQQFFYHF